MSRDRIDVEELKRRLLSDVEGLVLRLLPGARKQGRYFKFGGIGADTGNSAWVDCITGAWRDEADNRPAGDLISLYAECMCGGDNARALVELAEAYGLLVPDSGRPAAAPVAPPAPPAPAPKAEPKWHPIHPVPADAPHYTTQWAHFVRGVPNQHWEYRDQAGQLLGVVCRFDKPDGSKDVQPLSWAEGPGGKREWRYLGFGKPRPLYGLDRLPELNPDDPQRVVMVEGEKCADALYAAFPTVPVLAWPGGGKAVAEVDMAPLAGFRVLAWPDADAKREKLSAAEKAAGVDPDSKPLMALEDQPGVRAMRTLAAMATAAGATVQLVDVGQPGERPDGWDCADALAEGWTKAQIRELMAQRMADPVPAEPAPAAAAAPAPARKRAAGAKREAPAARAGQGGAGGPPGVPPDAPTDAGPGPAGDDDPGDDEWRDRLIFARGAVRECVPNVIELLINHPEWRGVLGFDEFAQRITKRKQPPFSTVAGAVISDEWTDVDDTRTAAWIGRHEGWVPGSAMVAEAVNVAARARPYHPVLEYLEGLQWDGTKRIDHWAADFLHVADSPYTRLVSRYFLIGMCRRVMEPGCKFDYCLVLEGKQGKRKSTALSILGGKWFSDIELDLTNKDAMSNIRGKWLHEFGEMGSIARAESTRQKSFLSRQVDEFRPTYGRREIRCPRQGAFAGTTNEWAWNKDPTGGRRFWPMEVRDEVNTDGLTATRDQLFAEAYALAKAGERFWPSGEEQRELFDPQQMEREAPEVYTELLAGWLSDERHWTRPDGLPRVEFNMSEACTEGLRIDAKGITRDIQTRVGVALGKLRCERKEYRTRAVRHWYTRPDLTVDALARAADDSVGGSEGLPV